MAKSPKTVIPPSPTAKDYAVGDYAFDAPRDLSWIEAEDPIALTEAWLADAAKTEINDPNTMALATLGTDGQPDVRMVLLKGLDDRGFVFYTNAQSPKGEQLRKAAKAALCFHWKSRRRQIRVRGEVEKVSDAESDAYWESRARHSQIGALASDQSRPVADRGVMMERVGELEAHFENQDIPRPDHWYGWRVKPSEIEFWQDGAFRIHDRILFTSSQNGWTKQRLFP